MTWLRGKILWWVDIPIGAILLARDARREMTDYRKRHDYAAQISGDRHGS